MQSVSSTQGATPADDGVHYSIWAPERKVSVRVLPEDAGSERVIPLLPSESGYHRGVDVHGKRGDRYLVGLDGNFLPCPCSHWQPDDLNGPSLVVDAADFSWTDAAWQRPEFRDLIIYEFHVGTFTPEGTYRAAIEKLPYLVDLGINAIEIMPIADFPGTRNWGYDGVRLYAPARIYGTPDDLRALVDAAHAQGIAVILDVVYNHFGPDGNYLRDFSAEYFENRHHTPWGEAINFRRREVRDYFVGNVAYWMEQFHIDGFRLDATHAIFDDSPTHILAELADFVHSRGGYIIAEDERNEGCIATPRGDNGFGLDAVWADDFHHIVEVALIDASKYRAEFAGELHELVDALQHGWVYRGQKSPRTGTALGTPCEHLPPQAFVFCISNHDQIGNRAFGERLNHFVSPETYRAASALLCLIPYTPLLFMGQEWAASTPFLYFTDHTPALGRLVDAGRRRELLEIPVFRELLEKSELPAPQARDTFERSRLDWGETTHGGHAACLGLYRAALRLRREHAAFRPRDRTHTHFAELKSGALAIRAEDPEGDWLVLCDLRGRHRGALHEEEFCALPAGMNWRLELSSNEPQFGGGGHTSFDAATGRFEFTHPELLVFQAEK